MKLKQLWLAFDRLMNVVVCWGSAQETMSSHCWDMYLQGKWWGRAVPVIDFLFSWETDEHCRKSYDAERRRWKAPANQTA